jgi:microcystin-dependent protein
VGTSYLGDVRAMSFDGTPAGWAPCKGQLLPIAQNTSLFALLGTAYGGDGETTFALPSLAPVPAQNGAALNYCICVQGTAPPQEGRAAGGAAAGQERKG